MKASQIFLATALTLGTGTAALAQTGTTTPTTGVTSTGAGGLQTGTQVGTNTVPSTMHNGASIGNNRDVLSPGTGTPATQGNASRPRRTKSSMPHDKSKMKAK